MSMKHLREAWDLEYNPFPPAAIAGEDSDDSPYDAKIVEKDRELFVEKLVVKAALPPGREFSYLWSQGKKDDTGFGKTRLMRRIAREINGDFGSQIVSKYKLPKGMRLAALWASMKMTGVTGIYALLFNVIVEAAKRPNAETLSLIEKCWLEIARSQECDPEDKDNLRGLVGEGILRARRKLFPGYPELREDFVEALSSCDLDVVMEMLESVSQAGRARNGLGYFEAFYCLVRAAGVDHFFVFIDQLEDLATAKNIPRATRQREVGRFRDIFAETSGFRGHCHAVFTFHNRAAQALADFWHLERINPPFWPQDPMGRPATAVIRGLTSTKQVERLLATYLDTVRDKPTGKADPFEPATFQVLLDRCEGRIGQLLPEAYAILEEAAEQQLPSISDEFILTNMPEMPEAETSTEGGADVDTLEALWKAKT